MTTRSKKSPKSKEDQPSGGGWGSAVNVHEAKTHLSRILKRVEMGEEIVVARAGKPVAKLVPIEPPRPKLRTFGGDAGKIWIAEDFDDPLPDEILDLFYK